MTRAAALVLLCASACIPSEGPMMAPFQDCLGCHGNGEGRAWTVAGTWRKGTHVSITDANGKNVPLRGNDAGNFYTAESLAFPLTVTVDGIVMPDPNLLTTPRPAAMLTYGGCNACHRAETVTTGPLMAPGTDCLTCHGPGGMATSKFSAAGTWARSAPGTTVQVAGYTTTTNSVGNFIFCAAGTTCRLADGTSYGTAAPTVSWPAPTAVGGSQMEGGAPDGHCNRCHGLGGEAGGD